MDRRTVLCSGLALSVLGLVAGCTSASTETPPAAAAGGLSFRDELGAFVANAYSDVAEVLRGEGWSNDIKGNMPLVMAAGGPDRLPPVFRKKALFSDPPRHTRLRRLIAPTVSSSAVERFRPRVAAIVDAALDRVAGRVDVLAELGYPIQIAVTADLHNVGPEGAELIRRQLPRLVNMLEIGADRQALVDAVKAVDVFTKSLLPILAKRSADPGDDLLSNWLTAEVDGDRLNHEEVIATYLLLLLGQETTAHLIANGTLALLENPDQLDLLRRRPELAGSAVDEILRLYGPVKMSGRLAKTDKHVGGQHIKRGQPLLVDISAANRDPAQFAEPERLDITRGHGPGVAFGTGPHLCLGTALVHMQVEETLLRLFGKYAGIQLPPGDQWRPTWRRTTAFRALDSLPVNLGTR
jgi:cytochrome P450